MSAAPSVPLKRRPPARASEAHPNSAFLTGLARAFGGAILFSLPLLMTMEMWWLGFLIPPGRLAVFLVVALPFLVGLSYLAGFEDTFDRREDVVDAFVALGVGFVASATVLLLLSVLEPDAMPLDELVGKIAVQAVPGAIGALLAQSQFGNSGAERPGERAVGYWWELHLMLVGAFFLALNIAPTEEIVLLAYRIGTPHLLTLVLVSLGAMHAFVYAVEFRGQHRLPEGAPWWLPWLRYTIPGYALALLASAGVLWVFGRMDDTSAVEMLRTTVILAFPAAIGAAAARLVL
jgi:putative integral membrane protein (TIGR02587 family)